MSAEHLAAVVAALEGSTYWWDAGEDDTVPPGETQAMAERLVAAARGELDSAPVVLVLHADGRADLTVADQVDDAALGGYLEQVAAMVRAGEHRNACPQCGTHGQHAHGDVPSTDARLPDREPASHPPVP